MKEDSDQKVDKRIVVHGCHGEPMDVEENETGEEVFQQQLQVSPRTTTEIRDVSDCGAEADADRNRLDPSGAHYNDCNHLSSGTSNTSLTDEEVQSEKSCVRPADSTNMRRFYRRRKRDLYK